MKFALDLLMFHRERWVAVCQMHSVLQAMINKVTSFKKVQCAFELNAFIKTGFKATSWPKFYKHRLLGIS